MSNGRKKDGGPAFPWGEVSLGENTGGVSMRDYFAGKALAGLCANPGGPFQANPSVGWDLTNCTDEDVATLTYRMADAMLKARAS